MRRTLKIARFGDNMRQVAVTEGDKVEAQIRFGYSVNGYGMGDLAAAVNAVSDAEVDRLCGQYDEQYAAEPLRKNGAKRQSLRDAARIELGLRAFCKKAEFNLGRVAERLPLRTVFAQRLGRFVTVPHIGRTTCLPRRR